MKFRTIDDLDVTGKRVLVRADLNVPMKDGVVTDALRIERQAPTIRQLAERGAKVIVLSHFDLDALEGHRLEVDTMVVLRLLELELGLHGIEPTLSELGHRYAPR